jgi:hypothetical protein
METPTTILALSDVIICCLLFVSIMNIPGIYPNFLKPNQKHFGRSPTVWSLQRGAAPPPTREGTISLWLQIAANVAKTAIQPSGMQPAVV